MKTKLIKLIALTFGLLAGAALHATPTGNILEILPCDSMGNTVDGPVSSIASPIVPGETIYFKVCLARTIPMREAARQWKMEYVGTGSPVLDAITSPFSMGIYVSGKLTFAQYVNYVDSLNVRGFIFKYTAELGDFALPVRLATESGPAGFDPISSSYVILNSDKFGIVDEVDAATKTPATLLFGPAEVPVTASGIIDYSLAANAGFYLKSVDFQNTQEDVGIWRVIPSGSTRTTGIKVESTAVLTNAVSLYVWSEDENVVKVAGGETVNMTVGYTSGVAVVKAVTVGTVKIARGESSANFSLTAGDVGHVGQVTNLVLSAYKNYFFNDSNEKLVDYLAAKVKCGEPDPPNVRITSADSTIVANYDYLTAKTMLTVSLNNYTIGSGEEVNVTINPKFQDGAVSNWWDYVYFSAQDTEQTITPADNKPVIKFTAATGNTKTIYVYALRSDSHTVGTGHQVQFEPTVNIPSITTTSAGLYISSAKPVVINPTEGATLSAIAGKELEVEVAVEDVYADMISDLGYTVKIKVGTKTTTFTGFKPTGEDNILRSVADNSLPTVLIPESESAGLKAATVIVTSPVTAKTSDTRNFNVQVEVLDQVHVDATLVGKADGDNVYYEGDQVQFKATFYNNKGEVVPNPNGTVLYAYLVANGVPDLSMFGGTAAKCIVADETVEDTATVGRQIYATANSATGSFTVLDGLSVGDGGMNYIFSVAICTTPYYNPATRVAEIKAGQGLDILVYNKEPTFNTVYLEGFEAEGDGFVFGNKYPRGQALEIKPEFSDAAYDLKHGFTYKWTASCNGVAVANGTTNNLDGVSINNTPFTYNFPQAGIWTVKIQMADKDMTSWAAETFSFSVEILNNPRLSVTPSSETLLETDTRATIDVSLGFYQSTDPIWVKLTVTPPTGTNPGRLVLDNTYKIRPDGITPEDDPNVYYVKFTSANAMKIGVNELDGTQQTIGSKTFAVKAEVVSTGQSIDPTKNWAQYYEPFSSKIYIENVTPVFSGVTPENSQSNAYQVAGGSASSYPIRWGIRSDVDGDMSGIAAFPGIKVTFVGCDNAESFFVTTGGDMSGTFIPNFGSVQGVQTVTMTIEDKDGGYQTWTYVYQISPSKFLKTVANGPGGTSTSALSQKYANATGIGEGHAYVRGANFSESLNFTLNWNCGKASSVDIFGFGYKVANPDDDGNLNGGSDIAIDQNGNSPLVQPPYHYPAADATADYRKDSFFYCWLLQSVDEQGNAANVVLGNTIGPERPGRVTTGRVPLPTEETPEGGYLETVVEGVYAKEWRVCDNLGDINQDGVPDVFVVKAWGEIGGNLIELKTGGEIVDNDLVSLNNFNPAMDFLPGAFVLQGTPALVANSKSSYAPIGIPFTTRLKVRGFHDGLNAVDLTTSDPDFSKDEGAAWAVYAATNGLNVAVTNLTAWSPEPRTAQFSRMDPTLLDTDGDGFPDGWEYYFWYKAHVWAPGGADNGKPKKGQAFVFEKFDPANIVKGTEIAADAVEARFNPCDPLQAATYADNPDFDGDGLTDLEELLIGTDPTHWDTDGDHMCDGWEVMMSLDPLNGSKNGNADGDFMACAYMEDCWGVDLGGILTFDLTGAIANLQPYDPATGEGDVSYTDGDPLYADKATYDGSGIISLTTDAKNGDDENNYALYCYDVISTNGLTVSTNTVYTTDSTKPGVSPAYEQVPTLVNDVTISGMLQALPKTKGDGSPYTYGLSAAEEENSDRWGKFMLTALMPDQTVLVPAGTQLTHFRNYILIHDQVRQAFGFDPRTGWYANVDGFLASRWNPEINKKLSVMPMDSTGRAVNTVPYTDYDEYLVMQYRLDFHSIAIHGESKFDAKDIWTTLKGYTTVPSVTVTTPTASTNGTASATNAVTTTASTTNAFSQALADAFAGMGSTKAPAFAHGADTDGDGVPDGWELYVGRNPNAAPGKESNEGTLEGKVAWDKDNDKLGWSAEFAGTDSCNAYSGCESIYKNHPGLATGWYNKFFPTDPDDSDTDGDSISDGSEGTPWTGTFYNGRRHFDFVKKLTFIYGVPADGLVTCIRGGGMNPLTVDSDKDGIPDPWEMQYCGVPVDASTRKATITAGDDESSVAVEFDDQTFVSDGLNGTEGAVVYIAGGMDATWPGDAYSDPYRNGNSFDKLTQHIRDVDFDHDGLQNWQEYLVQAVRHFRYDDAETPLMGKILDASGTPVDFGFVPMKQSASAFRAACAEVPDFATYSGRFTAAVWRDLGYMASPMHSWDMMSTCQTITPAILMPPETLGGLLYVSTDPRLADTDDDGMDDYWEMFHGLNPIFGASDPDSVASQDVIAMANGMPAFFNGYLNNWTGGSVEGAEAFDPIKYPWIMGAAGADPDGDGIRNDKEKILANLTSPLAYHTDPTPAWFTDTSSPNSYATLYYALSSPENWMPFWPLPVDGMYDEGSVAGGQLAWICAFEENEGYDTDNDGTGDGREIVRMIHTASDPLDFTDPSRRQGLYLNGTNAFAMTRHANCRPMLAADLLKQFTVEAWVRPSVISGREQTILERSSVYGAAALNKDDGAIRANFRLGIDASGHPFGLFDNDDAIESAQNSVMSFQKVTATTNVLAVAKWTHLAMTYDGHELRLYVNGVVRVNAQTTLIPANGVSEITQNIAQTNGIFGYTYKALPTAFFLGARPKSFNAGGAVNIVADDADNANMQEHFAGWVDEVRVWDGARTSAEIASAYGRELTKEDVAANREKVYKHLMSATADSSRNDNDGLLTLDAELLQHYSFSTLPGANLETDVAKTPIGFGNAVAGQIQSPAAGFSQNIGWWAASPAKSTVYTDYTYLPWIENTVRHLPLLDGSAVDSFIYNEYLGGFVNPAWSNTLERYTFNNSAVPYGDYIYGMDRLYRYNKLLQYQRVAGAADAQVDDVVRRDMFDLRSGFIGTGDLVPMGGAFAKICPDFWDGQGATAPWETTRVDSDGDGLPDWWETKYSVSGLSTTAYDWDKEITYKGRTLPAWQAYLRDLASGMQPSGTTDPAMVQTADDDGDGIVDWWQQLYGVAEGADGDDDRDGLPNYVEYLLSEVFSLNVSFDPRNPFSVTADVSDFYYRIGQMYVGEIFTDHDRTRDAWELGFGSDFIRPDLYDAGKDNDGDGWSNFAEFMSGTDPDKVGSNGIDNEQIRQYPAPVIRTTLSYDGTQNIAEKRIIVRAWKNYNAVTPTVPDAQWTIGGDSSSASGQTGTNSVTGVVSGSRYIGLMPKAVQTLHLAPGWTTEGSVKIKFNHREFRNGYDGAFWGWEQAAYDRPDKDKPDTGVLIENISGDVVGNINYVTGQLTIDFALFANQQAFQWPHYTDDGVHYTTEIYAKNDAYAKIEWSSKTITDGDWQTYYLAEADKRTVTNNSFGHIKEGENLFVAFYDLDGDGKYTAGEPYGAQTDIDVSWNYAEVAIQMTDTSPITGRFSVSADGSGNTVVNDRAVLWGSMNGDFPNVSPIGSPSGGLFDKVTIVRTMIDGTHVKALSVPQAIVLGRVGNTAELPYITEADFLSLGVPDIDWNLATDIAGKNLKVTNVTYRVVMGDGDPLTSSNLLSYAFNRWFDATNKIATALGPDRVTVPSPTFSWSIPDATVPGHLDSYTAFQIRVKDASNVTVYDSGAQRMPARKSDVLSGNRYDWTAPICADNVMTNGTTVFRNDANYTWQVRIFNSKFRVDDNKSWTAPRGFAMNVSTNATNLGQMNVSVRYMGPDAVLTNGVVRVQAFETPDFTGRPVSEGYVADKMLVHGANVNARLIGLEAGTYYVRAFVDTVKDDVRQDWESWGYACERDSFDAAIFDPKPVYVGRTQGASETVVVYIDDCDTDQDNLPDAWEWVQSGNLGGLGTGSLKFVSGFAVKNDLALAVTGSGTLTKGLAVRTTSALSSPYVAAMLLNVPAEPENVDAALAGLTETQTLEPKTVVITSIDLDQVAKTVTIGVAGEATVESTSGLGVASTFYTIEVTTAGRVYCQIQHKDALSDTEWTNWGEQDITEAIKTDGVESLTVGFGDLATDAAGFYRAILVTR